MNNAILDHLLKYIAAYLPPPLYSVLIKLLSHLYAAATSLCHSFLSENPADWNIQAFLPALISIMAAYLALATLYRTTSWVLRTSFWFIKWGTIISILLAGASYYMGNDIALPDQDIIPDIGRYMTNLGNGGQGSQDWRRTKSRQRRKQKSQRPKAWESFERHREWQYQEANNGAVEGEHLMATIADAVDHVLKRNGWWAVAKNLWGNTAENSGGGSSKNTNSRKPPSGGSRSR